MKSLVACLLSLMVTTNLYALQKPLAEYWKSVGLKYSTVEAMYNNKECGAQQTNFLSCVGAANASLGEGKNKLSWCSRKRFWSS
jgi:hypothetical protein